MEKPKRPDPALVTTVSGSGIRRPEILETPLPAGFAFAVRLLDGPEAGRVIPLTRARQTLGRSDADILIPDDSISRKHAAIEIYDADFIYLKDLASTNGTQLNGELINAAKLRHGDEIRLGDRRLAFEIERGAAPVPA